MKSRLSGTEKVNYIFFGALISFLASIHILFIAKKPLPVFTNNNAFGEVMMYITLVLSAGIATAAALTFSGKIKPIDFGKWTKYVSMFWVPFMFLALFFAMSYEWTPEDPFTFNIADIFVVFGGIIILLISWNVESFSDAKFAKKGKNGKYKQ